MSAGAFAEGKYQDDDGNIYSCRVQPETVELTINSTVNALPAGPVDQPISARMTGSRRKYGCRARSVRIQFSGTPPEGYEDGSIIELPVFTQTAWLAMKAVRRATGTYLEAPVIAIGYTAESVK